MPFQKADSDQAAPIGAICSGSTMFASKNIVVPGQQIRYKIDSFQNANFLISQQNPMMLPLIRIVSERRFQ